METIIQVWHVRATGTQGLGHYVVLFNDGTHLCTFFLLINKGLVRHHFFRVGTYSSLAVFHTGLIPIRWHQDLNVSAEMDLVQQATRNITTKQHNFTTFIFSSLHFK